MGREREWEGRIIIIISNWLVLTLNLSLLSKCLFMKTREIDTNLKNIYNNK